MVSPRIDYPSTCGLGSYVQVGLPKRERSRQSELVNRFVNHEQSCDGLAAKTTISEGPGDPRSTAQRLKKDLPSQSERQEVTACLNLESKNQQNKGMTGKENTQCLLRWARSGARLNQTEELPPFCVFSYIAFYLLSSHKQDVG